MGDEFQCNICKEKIINAEKEKPVDITLRKILGHICGHCGWTICNRCDPFYDSGGFFRLCPGCGGEETFKFVNEPTFESERWSKDDCKRWIADRNSHRFKQLRAVLVRERLPYEPQLRYMVEANVDELAQMVSSAKEADWTKTAPREQPGLRAIADLANGRWVDFSYFEQDWVWKDKKWREDAIHTFQRSFLVETWRDLIDEDVAIKAYFIRCYRVKFESSGQTVPNFILEEVQPPEKLKQFIREIPQEPAQEKGRAVGQFDKVVYGENL